MVSGKPDDDDGFGALAQLFIKMTFLLIDATYELFRHFYGLRRFTKGKDRPYGAVVGVLQTVLQMIENGDTYLGVATDHVIEPFAIALGGLQDCIERALLARFHPLEEALAAMISSSMFRPKKDPTRPIQHNRELFARSPKNY